MQGCIYYNNTPLTGGGVLLSFWILTAVKLRMYERENREKKKKKGKKVKKSEKEKKVDSWFDKN